MKIKRVLALLLAVALCAGALAACGGETGGKEQAYSVKVVDGQGAPYTTGVIVKFMQGDTQVAMQLVNAEGIAEKTLPKGDYTLELVFTDESVSGYYDPVEAVLTAEKSAIEIAFVSAADEKTIQLMATSPVTGESREYTAHYITEGSTHISVEAKEKTYFIFVPTQSGTYEVSVDDSELKPGYFGTPFFVQTESVEEVVDGRFTMDIANSMVGQGDNGTVTLVIGVEGAQTDKEATLSITRIGEPGFNISDQPWTPYITSHTPAPFTLEQGDKELTYIDINGATADNQVVYNEADGYYHFGAADGPVVYMHLGKGAPYVSLQIVIYGDGPMGGASIRKYFFDENGNFEKKEDYSDILTEYFNNMDPQTGVYPLTEDLIYILHNGCSGWWDATSPDYILEGCNPEIGWMFALCYLK